MNDKYFGDGGIVTKIARRYGDRRLGRCDRLRELAPAGAALSPDGPGAAGRAGADPDRARCRVGLGLGVAVL